MGRDAQNSCATRPFQVESCDCPDRDELYRRSSAAVDRLEEAGFPDPPNAPFAETEANAARRLDAISHAGREAGQLLLGHTGDGPLLHLLARAATLLARPNPGDPFDPVWEAPTK